jgi:hypothetical protein
MDEKLARGRARELFRHLAKRSKLDSDPATPVLAKLLEAYLVQGGVDESRLKDFAERLEADFGAIDQITVASQFVRHPVKNKIIMEVTRPGCVEGSEQPWMIARSNTYVLQRNVLKLIETVHHVAISQHAIFRLFERGNMKSGSIVGLLDSVTLWVPTLLLALFGMKAPPTKAGTQIALPFAGGLLLGDIQVNYLEGPEQGPRSPILGEEQARSVACGRHLSLTKKVSPRLASTRMSAMTNCSTINRKSCAHSQYSPSVTARQWPTCASCVLLAILMKK